VVGVALHDVEPSTAAGATASSFMAAVAASLSEYLHVPVSGVEGIDAEVTVDRSDTHLDREIDAVLETLVIGLKRLERDHPADLVVLDATIGVEV
jgi:hypothetical protein